MMPHLSSWNDYLRNMSRICITGNKGFIGSKIQERLKKMGHTVLGYDIVDGENLLDLETLERKITQVDAVYHIAAQADLTKMQDLDGARAGVWDNVEGTHNVAYLCAKHNKWLIHASTVCVYGNVNQHPEKEDETLPNPSELYANSKYAAEWIVKGYAKNFDFPWTILRFATIYGAGMRPAMGMHIFFRQAIKGEPITVHGKGDQDRTLTYIDDLVDGIVAVMFHPESQGQIINLTSSESISANKMADDIKKITGSKSPIVHISQRPNQTIHEEFDVSKAEKLLNWKAETNWDKGLAKTYFWIKEELKK